MQTSLIQWTLDGMSRAPEYFSSPYDIHQKISKVEQLPLLAGVAAQILELAANPNADVQQLVNIIEVDLILAAQVIRWSHSPVYRHHGKIASVHDAVTRVLGFDFVLDVALSLTTLEPLHVNPKGVLGTKMIAQHALLSVQLMQALSQRMPEAIRPAAYETFVAALLHNIGFSLFAHYFEREFNNLNKIFVKNPTLELIKIEKFLFNLDHSLLGAWLMQAWNMPEFLVNVVYHHHNPYYQGEYYQLNQLTYLSDCLLGSLGIGDAQNQRCPASVYASLQLTQPACEEALGQVLQNIDQIKLMAD